MTDFKCFSYHRKWHHTIRGNLSYAKETSFKSYVQLKTANDNDVIFIPCSIKLNLDLVTNTLHSELPVDLYMSVTCQIMSSGNSKIKWNQRRDKIPRSFIEMLQIFTENTATSSKYLLGYSMNVKFFNFSAQLRLLLIDKGYLLVGFLTVGL